jgi:hypothetical protein
MNSQKRSARKVGLFRSDDAIVRSPGVPIPYLTVVRIVILLCLITTVSLLVAGHAMTIHGRFNSGLAETAIALSLACVSGTVICTRTGSNT